MKTQSQTQKTKEPKLLTASELPEKAGCYLQIPGHSSAAIAADVYRTVKQDEIKAEHQRFGPLSLRC